MFSCWNEHHVWAHLCLRWMVESRNLAQRAYSILLTLREKIGNRYMQGQDEVHFSLLVFKTQTCLYISYGSKRIVDFLDHTYGFWNHIFISPIRVRYNAQTTVYFKRAWGIVGECPIQVGTLNAVHRRSWRARMSGYLFYRPTLSSMKSPDVRQPRIFHDYKPRYC